MIQQSDNFANLNAWNVTQISGSVAVAGNEATFTPGATGFDKLGLTRKAGFSPDAYWSASIDINQSHVGSCNFMIGLWDSQTLSYASGTRYALYIDGGGTNAYSYDGGTTTSLGFSTTAAAYKTLKFQFDPNYRTVSIYYDGVLKSRSVNYGSGWDVFGDDVYFHFNVDQVNGSGGTLKIKNYVVNDNAGISVERGASSGAESEIATVDMGVQLYADTGRVPGNTYYYRTRQFRGSTYGPYSNEVSVTTPAAGGAGVLISSFVPIDIL